MMLSSSMKEGHENRINVTDTKPEVFQSILEFIYTDEIILKDIDLVISLLVEANKYGLTRLKSLCEHFLAKRIDQENVVEFLGIADTHEASELRRVCLDYAVIYFDVITKRKDFDQLSKQTIVDILKHK